MTTVDVVYDLGLDKDRIRKALLAGQLADLLNAYVKSASREPVSVRFWPADIIGGASIQIDVHLQQDMTRERVEAMHEVILTAVGSTIALPQAYRISVRVSRAADTISGWIVR